MNSKDNKKFPYAQITNNIRVSVMTEFLEEQSDINKSLWVWAYHITIENNGIKTVQLLERYWKIIDESGKIKEVEGLGVIGLQPLIEPGEHFTYTSGTPLSTPSGFMGGHYEMETNKGKKFEAIIPQFSLDSPFIKNNLN